MTRRTRRPAAFAWALLALTVGIACSGGSEQAPASTAAPTESPSPAPRDPQAAQVAFEDFIRAVETGTAQDAWKLYAASVPGKDAEHRSDRGCDFDTFSFELTKIQYLFQQTA